MRILILGDVVGRGGRRAVEERLPELRTRYKLDFVVVNGENAAGGFGVTEAIFSGLVAAGADVVTLGNHAFDQRDCLVFIERHPNLLRPINYPKETPGRGAGVFKTAAGKDVLVINALGRVFMNEMDCPFQAVDHEVAASALGHAVDATIIDFHAEATSEKQAMGHFLDGRVSLVSGTHTHTPTSDYRILAGGTAYISDIGMCGDYDSVLGMKKEEPINRFLTRVPRERFEPAGGPPTLSGLAVEIDEASGLATYVSPVRLGGAITPAEPLQWLEKE